METDNILNNRTRFADYFVICGLDLTSGLEPDSFAGDTLQSTPLERPYKCKVLGHYPENVSWNPFDKDAVCMLCLPNGLQFRTQKSNLEPKFHSFIITKEDGRRSYGASFIFYEEIRNRKICSAMQTLQAMHLTELSSGRCKRSMEHNTRSLPRHFKLSAHTRAAQSYYEYTKDTLYVTKSIALIMQQPYIHAPHIFLAGLYRCWKDQGSPSLESLVYSLLYEVCVPPPGRSLSFICYPQEKVVLQTPTNLAELPFFDFPLRELFTLLGVDCVIQLFTCLLLENQILLCSGEYQRLMLVAESLTNLLLPFSWPHVYVPILPASCHHFLDAPVPFVMGLHTRESRVNVPSEANLCYMDLDTRLLQTPEELPSFPHKTEFADEICDILRRHKVSGEYVDMNLNSSGDKLMTSSCINMRTRKHSWADDLEDDPSLTQGSEMLQRIVSLNKRSGVSLDALDDLNDDWDSMVDDGFSEETEISSEMQYMKDLQINNAVREIFLNRFVQMFSTYEHFIIQPNQDKEEWLNNRDSMQNFDKATFLSDQPQHHLPFLSRFIETQMFATLVDNKILSNWCPLDPLLRVFETRIKLVRNRYGESLERTPCYEPCTTISDSQLEKRLSSIDTEILFPTELFKSHAVRSSRSGFPILDSVTLNQEPVQRSKKRNVRMTNSFSSLSFEGLEMEGIVSVRRPGSEARPLVGGDRLTTVPTRTDPSPALIALSNWEFIEILLKECKQKTKRMLVEKLGSEALAMGHGAQTSIVEENTLIASLCDLLERVWSNGIQKKQGKSALWAHLMNYLELEESTDTTKPIDSNHLGPALTWHVWKKRMDYLSSGSIELSPESRSSPRSRSESRTSNTRRLSEDFQQEPTLRPLPNTLAYDLRSVQAMTDIKTHVGYARAFVRLSLEKKMLSKHLRTLLSESTLLRSQYKRTAFLRCEEEKDQFLYHLLSLNAVDYNCFTNTYLNTRIPYRIAIYPSRKNSFSSTTANCWIQVYGSHGETQRIPVPKATLEFVFHHKNLGYLTTTRIGHDNSGLSPKWLVEYIIVRNEVTSHTYNFPCGRWLGKGIDDDSIERLLVGEREKDRDIDRGRSSRVRSPSVPPPKKVLPLSEIEHLLGDCVNNLVKYFYCAQGKESSSSLTMLLCGDTGLVSSLEQAFLYGFKSSRLFGRNLYIWDYLLKVREDRTDSFTPFEEKNIDYKSMRYYFRVIDAIMNSGQNLGKDGRFQIFICFCVRDHMLQHIIFNVLATSRTTLEMFEENSFFRDQDLLSYMIHILSSLDEFNFSLENSLAHGITF
ncbi:DENN domain-containing protein 5B isoform X2 [Halyomorpha halys]|uniref:DENN domain-containing protein 5B isoform X2 n=1 Tax=Halyomorpha halys TaxID=286706 RepID=UPI0006D501E2